MPEVLAAVPLVAACVLLGAGAGAVRAAVAAVACAVIIAGVAFPVPPERGSWVASSLGPTTVEVVLILLGGVMLSELLSASGAQGRLADWVRSSCVDQGRAVLLIVLGITPFAEAVTGFGIGVVVAVPLLRRIGLPAAKSAVLGLLGLVVVPWGALAPGTLVAAQLGGVDFDLLGVRSAVLSGPVFVIAGAAALTVACGPRRAAGHVPDLMAVAGALWVAVWGANLLLGTPLAGAIGGLAGAAAALGLSRTRDRVPLRIDAGTRLALRPYALLVGGLLVSSLALRAGGADGTWAVVASPATWLVLTCLAAPTLVGLRGPGLHTAVGTAMRRWWPIAVATALFLTLGGILTATGMSAEPADSAGRLGPVYLFLAPVVGGLGGFITGSNTGANAMFAASQVHAAHALGASPLQMLATQNVSASLLTMASPPRVALAVSQAGADWTGASTRGRDRSPATTQARAGERAGIRGVLLTVLAADGVVIVVLGALNVVLS